MLEPWQGPGKLRVVYFLPKVVGSPHPHWGPEPACPAVLWDLRRSRGSWSCKDKLPSQWGLQEIAAQGHLAQPVRDPGPEGPLRRTCTHWEAVVPAAEHGYLFHRGLGQCRLHRDDRGKAPGAAGHAGGHRRPELSSHHLAVQRPGQPLAGSRLPVGKEGFGLRGVSGPSGTVGRRVYTQRRTHPRRSLCFCGLGTGHLSAAQVHGRARLGPTFASTRLTCPLSGDLLNQQLLVQ